MIRFVVIIVVAVGLIAFLRDKFSSSGTKRPVESSIYDFNVSSLEGKAIDFSTFKGKNLLIVNTASKCGYTPQYEDLQKLHDLYGDKVVVLGFPANNFLWQEPGSNNDIAQFCERNYGVTFQMFEKVSVKGKDQHPVFDWLEAKTGKIPSWNFCKYVVTNEGNDVAFFSSAVNPLDDAIVNLILKK